MNARCAILTLVALAVAGAIGMAAVVGFGLFNVSAAAGHLPGVSWILHTTFQNSVELRAPDSEAVPPLTDEMAAIGARHYDTACRPCHAAPGERQTWTMRSLVPEPPHIAQAVEGWKPGHLFWIAQNGVKMTGMPHWPAPERRDEIWMMAAFLARVGAMSPAEYAELTERPSVDDPVVAYCAMCHGLDGAGRGNSQMPRLDIQDAPYIAASLFAYRDAGRFSGIMQQAASQLTDEEIEMLAERFGSVEVGPPVAPKPLPADLVAAGRALAFGGADSTGTPACRACHGPWPSRRSPLFPALAGQRMDYLVTQLTLWSEERRGGSRRAHLMHQVAELMDAADIRALAAFYAAGAPPR